MSDVTTGLGVAAKVVITSDLLPVGVSVPNAVELSLSSVSPDSSTYQIEAELQDLGGNIIAASPPDALFYYSQNPDVATVDDSGLITAVAVGHTVVEVSYPFASNLLGDNPNFGWPDEKIWFEINVTVLL